MQKDDDRSAHASISEFVNLWVWKESTEWAPHAVKKVCLITSNTLRYIAHKARSDCMFSTNSLDGFLSMLVQLGIPSVVAWRSYAIMLQVFSDNVPSYKVWVGNSRVTTAEWSRLGLITSRIWLRSSYSLRTTSSLKSNLWMAYGKLGWLKSIQISWPHTGRFGGLSREPKGSYDFGSSQSSSHRASKNGDGTTKTEFCADDCRLEI